MSDQPESRPDGTSAQEPSLASGADDTSLQDVKQLGLVAGIASLGWVFWVVGGMEMVERLAYYGVKAVASLYVTDAESTGALGATLVQYGVLMGCFAFVSSLLPIFTGGLSDRYGYKETIFVSTVVKIAAYLIMALWHSYTGFFVGCMVLAAGTAIFKPGIQGTLVKATNRQNSSLAWGIFYQTVNIGGYLGPLLAAALRILDWTYLFYACAGIIALNFLLLLTYREVGKEERLERKRQVEAGEAEQENLVVESLKELIKPHVWTYLLLFSGFWFMFMALFDVLPLQIRDWVDSSDVVNTFSSAGVIENPVLRRALGMNTEGTAILPEGMLNLNAGLIMTTCFLFAFVSSKMRATTSMVVGTLLAALAMFSIGSSMVGWLMVGSIAIFSIGEMLSSPKFSEFIGNFAPSDKKAMYLGFSQIPIAIGWTIEGPVAPLLYRKYADKDRFSREYLLERLGGGDGTVPAADTVAGYADQCGVSVEALMEMDRRELIDAFTEHTTLAGPELTEAIRHVHEWSRITSYCETNNIALSDLQAHIESDSATFVEQIPPGEAFDWLVSLTGQTGSQLTQTLYEMHNVGVVWYLMMGIGIVSAIGIWIYGKWILTLKKS